MNVILISFIILAILSIIAVVLDITVCILSSKISRDEEKFYIDEAVNNEDE